MGELERVVPGAVQALREVAQLLEESLAMDGVPFVDITAQLPVNHKPTHADMVGRRLMWWPVRDMRNITGITVHHTMSHSPQATARYCTGSKGYPSIQYHFWVSAGDGCPVWRCAPVEWGIWHDNTGAISATIAVGLAGSLHLQRPPEEQLQAAVRVVDWLMREYGVPLAEVKGHKDRYTGTICPGWDAAGWRQDFYEDLVAVGGWDG